ncbi:MAG: hypothetical protein CME70_11395 [Halobacteriovorax sp.]|nr:hypothetical protein [Halobacteriovorax sp.]|tara:strand:+ start:75725 stop:76453 length:729 start_codon:yes stop_codon:yes gene_type:complete
MENSMFLVKGITCGSCIKQIEDGLSKLEDLNSVKFFRNPDRLKISSRKTIQSRELNHLFKENDLSKYTVSNITNPKLEKLTKNESLVKKLFPLILVISYLTGTVTMVAIHTSDYTYLSLMSHYMAGFFLIFSFFKLLNIEGFADAFQTYDPIASKFRGYGYIYASFEALAGIGYLFYPRSIILNFLVLLLLSISSVGVYKAVKKKSQIQCACLGTIFNLPMTKVTIVENVSMIAMALLMITM